MPELQIEVVLPGVPGRSYRFSETPVLVGRAETCHLGVRHAAMPRELCRIWLENDGRRVRVEERPGLTNPLLAGGRPVRGGVSGPRLELTVGPVRLVAEPAGLRQAGGRAHPRRRVLAGLGVLALVAGLALVLGSSPRGTVDPLAARLPSSPFPRTGEAGSGTGGDPGRAALLESRAAELLSRPEAAPADGIEAALLLRRAASLLPQDEARTVAARALALEAALAASYREQGLALERALARGDARAASQAAGELLSYLEHHEDAGARRRLALIAAGAP